MPKIQNEFGVYFAASLFAFLVLFVLAGTALEIRDSWRARRLKHRAEIARRAEF